jgi:rSAM/selenodomain-associated transferase 1
LGADAQALLAVNTTKGLAIGVMTRAPSAPGKTRLAPYLAPERLAALRRAMLLDTLQIVRNVAAADVVVFVTPDAAVAEIEGSVPQGEGDLGERMRSAFAHLLDARGFAAAILVGADIPLMRVEAIQAAQELLSSSSGIVLGPADDGGYYLIGATKVHPTLFRKIAWGSATVLTDTLRAAERADIEARLIASAYDIDTIDGLRRVERDLAALPASVAPTLRDWFTA